MESTCNYTLNNLINDFDKLKEDYSSAVNTYFIDDEWSRPDHYFISFAHDAESVFNRSRSLIRNLNKVQVTYGQSLFLATQFMENDIKCKFNAALHTILSGCNRLNEEKLEVLRRMNIYQS